jgi:hypothetical protein
LKLKADREIDPFPAWSYFYCEPGRSTEKGFALIRTSRIEDSGGIRPPLNPSM